MTELLSPAGEYESLEVAVDYGCDAVYLGGQRFGMRTNPKNFNAEELSRAVGYAHRRGVKVYLTCNTVPTNAEIGAYPRFIREAAKRESTRSLSPIPAFYPSPENTPRSLKSICPHRSGL